MHKFQDAYQDAARILPELQMDTDRAKDELHHYRMRRQRRNYLIVKGCTAASIFLLFGVGTVAAKTYRDSIIRVNDNGVTITAQQAENDTGLSELFSFLEQAGGVFSIAGAGPDEYGMEAGELETIEYNSIEDFLASEDVRLALPDMGLFPTEFEEEKICIAGGGMDVSLHVYNEEYSFSLTQFDNREVESYSTAMSFGGRSTNERNFTSSQGLNYVVFDNLDEQGSVISVCAVVSVNGWDLTLTFRGFDRKTIEKIINSIDLSIYFS